MTPPPHRPRHEKSSEVSRRTFIAGVGATAAGAAAIGALPAITGHDAADAAVPADRFGRMFPNLPPFRPASDQLRAALIDIGKAGGVLDARDPLEEGPIRLITNPELSPRNRDNPFQTAAPSPVAAPRPGSRSGAMLAGSMPGHEGLLLLDSDPSGARVYVDGMPVGQTPVAGIELAFGRHVVRMEADGREPVSAEVELKPERPLKAVAFTLPVPHTDDGSVRKGQFVTFGPGVTPPRRIAGVLPSYPEAARERGLEGAPSVEVWVSETGEIIDVAILESAGATLDGALLEAVAAWRFAPASLRGVPVSVRFTIQHLFRR